MSLLSSKSTQCLPDLSLLARRAKKAGQSLAIVKKGLALPTGQLRHRWLSDEAPWGKHRRLQLTGFYEEIWERQIQAEELATKLLATVRVDLRAVFPDLDKVGADAIMLNALLVSAGKHRYYWPTLQWLVETAYAAGHRPYDSPVLGRFFDEKCKAAYNPFGPDHHFKPEVDEDHCDPEPDYVRPLRFLEGDLYKWEHELGTSVEDTQRLYRRADIDDEPASGN